jgi:hypothetical protein
MYTRERMDRNLGVGNIAEAFFRNWFDKNVSAKRPDLILSQFGYNPEGLVVGREKVEMLKRLPRSPDYALFDKSTIGTDREKPIIGISVNGQGSLYTMHNARAPWLCWTCSRGAQQPCYEEKFGNLWYNRYNITNDYQSFTKLFETEVVLVTIVARWLGNVFKSVREEGLANTALQYVKHGEPRRGEESISISVDKERSDLIRFLDLLRYQQQGKHHTKPRPYTLHWLPYSDVLNNKIPQSVTGAPVNIGQPREVVCIDSRDARGESQLVEYLKSLQA